MQRVVRSTAAAAGAALFSDDLASQQGLQRDYAGQTVDPSCQPSPLPVKLDHVAYLGSHLGFQFCP